MSGGEHCLEFGIYVSGGALDIEVYFLMDGV